MARISEHAIANRIYEDFEPLSNWRSVQGFETLTVSLPGFRKEQLKLQVTTTRKLTVMGEHPTETNKWIRFRKEFFSPSNVDDDSFSATFDGTNLVVRLPRTEPIGKQMSPIGKTAIPPLVPKEIVKRPSSAAMKKVQPPKATREIEAELKKQPEMDYDGRKRNMPDSLQLPMLARENEEALKIVEETNFYDGTTTKPLHFPKEDLKPPSSATEENVQPPKALTYEEVELEKHIEKGYDGRKRNMSSGIQSPKPARENEEALKVAKKTKYFDATTAKSFHVPKENLKPSSSSVKEKVQPPKATNGEETEIEKHVEKGSDERKRKMSSEVQLPKPARKNEESLKVEEPTKCYDGTTQKSLHIPEENLKSPNLAMKEKIHSPKTKELEKQAEKNFNGRKRNMSSGVQTPKPTSENEESLKVVEKTKCSNGILLKIEFLTKPKTREGKTTSSVEEKEEEEVVVKGKSTTTEKEHKTTRSVNWAFCCFGYKKTNWLRIN